MASALPLTLCTALLAAGAAADYASGYDYTGRGYALEGPSRVKVYDSRDFDRRDFDRYPFDHGARRSYAPRYKYGYHDYGQTFGGFRFIRKYYDDDLRYRSPYHGIRYDNYPDHPDYPIDGYRHYDRYDDYGRRGSYFPGYRPAGHEYVVEVRGTKRGHHRTYYDRPYDYRGRYPYRYYDSYRGVLGGLGHRSIYDDYAGPGRRPPSAYTIFTAAEARPGCCGH